MAYERELAATLGTVKGVATLGDEDLRILLVVCVRERCIRLGATENEARASTELLWHDGLKQAVELVRDRC